MSSNINKKCECADRPMTEVEAEIAKALNEFMSEELESWEEELDEKFADKHTLETGEVVTRLNGWILTDHIKDFIRSLTKKEYERGLNDCKEIVLKHSREQYTDRAGSFLTSCTDKIMLDIIALEDGKNNIK
jgi:type I site-specific restriction-modification system R (restriction) subunit